MDTIDFEIIKAISDLLVPCPRVERINSRVKIDPEELGARLGVLEMQGYVNNRSETEDEGSCLPNGICATRLTNQGKRVLTGPRW